MKVEITVMQSGLWIMLFPLFATLLAIAPPKLVPRESNYERVAPPQRLVMLPPLLAAYASLDHGLFHVIGASDFVKRRFQRDFLSHIYEGSDRLQSAGSIALTDPELILSLKPDAVIVWPHSATAAREIGLSEIVLNIDDGVSISLSTRLRIWSTLGALCGEADKAEQLADWFQTQRRLLAVSLDLAVSGPRVVFFNGAADGLGYLAGKDFYLNSFLDFLRARNAAASVSWGQVNLETAAMLDPDVIILDSTLREQDPRELYDSPKWSIVRAVREKRVYLMPRFNFWAPPMDEHLILRWLAEILYPNMPRVLRESYRTSFALIHNVTLSEYDLDQLLFMRQNSASARYERFEDRKGLDH